MPNWSPELAPYVAVASRYGSVKAASRACLGVSADVAVRVDSAHLGRRFVLDRRQHCWHSPWARLIPLSCTRAALERKRRAEPPTPRKLDGAGEARLIALACGEPPEGRARWTLRLLAGKMVELAIVDGISHETVRRTLKKRVEAAYQGVLVHSPVAERRVRGGDGRRAQTL